MENKWILRFNREQSGLLLLTFEGTNEEAHDKAIEIYETSLGYSDHLSRPARWESWEILTLEEWWEGNRA